LLRTGAAAALALALFGLCACHAMLAPFSYTWSERHAGRESFLRIAGAAEVLREVIGTADFLFWYDRQEEDFRRIPFVERDFRVGASYARRGLSKTAGEAAAEARYDPGRTFRPRRCAARS
jgi:hypothetical protein